MTPADEDLDDEDVEGAGKLRQATPGRRYGRRMGDAGSEYQASNIWIVSFTDIMALMLTFFVLLYSMSAPETETWKEMTAALQKEFNRHMGAAHNRGPQDTIDISRIDYNRALDLNYLSAIIGKMTEDNEALGALRMQQVSGRLVLSLPQDLVFEAGKADVSGAGADALYALGGKLSRIRNRIEIIGHADPRGFDGEAGEFSSNWDLSLARSLNAAAALRKVGYSRPLTVRGLGSALYDDLPQELSEGVRMDMARRVDFVISDDDGSSNTFNGLGIH